MLNEPTKKRKILYMDDKLPFGKYAGKTLSEVYYEDPSYANWMDNNVTYYQFEWNINTKWSEILDKNDTAPNDGLYLMVCQYDMPIYYEVNEFTQGDRFWKKYDEENKNNGSWYDANCLAYRFIEEFSEHSAEWTKATDSIEKKTGCLMLFAVADEDDNFQYHILTYEPLWEITGLKNVTIKGYQYIPYYTGEMVINHWDLWRLKHPKQTDGY